MNIAQAKVQIANAMQAYFAKDEYGNYLIPPESQRPVFLMGPPGIGKTAIMKQVAEEAGVGLVSYSMTHHTRQSTLGLPLIVSRCYDGKEYKVTEYTMSEIIASVYEMMETGGVREGILFLDEINCVSETLTPTMLQFLQFKTFGKHRIPDGWIIVTAGNPPEYNRSAREFDIVTWDRLKRIDIEPDFPAWKLYAGKKGVHPAVLTYLDAKKDRFYRVETTVDGKRFVTARGWDDLSEMIKFCESRQIPVDAELIGQYVRDADTAEDFAVYYALFRKYRADYQVDRILAGCAGKEIEERAAAAPFDERLSLLGLLLDGTQRELRAVMETEDALKLLMESLKKVKGGLGLADAIGELEQKQQSALHRGTLSPAMRAQYARALAFLQDRKHEAAAFEQIREKFGAETTRLREAADAAGKTLEALFLFAEKVWGEGELMLILVTELTENVWSARFLARYGCEAYFRHNRELMFYERQTEIIKELERLEMTI